MGSEDLFNKRKVASAERLQRNKTRKTGKQTILIVCEGEKTEPDYFRALLRHLGLQSRVQLGEIAVDSRETGLDPSRLVERAKELFFNRRNEGMTYDRVYCVFDKDCHAKYAEACKTIEGQPLGEIRGGKSGKAERLAEMIAITSVPCFEVWLLFHFTVSSAPFHASGKRTPCEQVIEKLGQYPQFAKYRKGSGNAFGNTKDKLDTALTNAERIWRQRETNGDNPSTRIFELVAYLKAEAGR